MSNEVDKTLWVGNLSDKISDDILYELFLQAGPLSRVNIAKEKDGRKKSFAFVTFVHETSVPYTINLMDGMQLFGKNLRLQSRPGSIHQQQRQEQQQQQQFHQHQNHHRHMNNPYQSNQPMPSNPYGMNQPIRNQQQHQPQLHKSHTWHGDDLDQLNRERDIREARDRDRSSQKDRDRSGSRRREDENGRGRRNDYDHGSYRDDYRQNSPNNRNNSSAEDFEAKKQRVLQKQDQMLSRYRHDGGRSGSQYHPRQSNPYHSRRGRY